MSVPRVYDMIYGKLRDGLAKKPAYVRYLFNWAVEVGCVASAEKMVCP